MPAPSLRSIAARMACVHQNAIDPASHLQLFARDRGRFRRITRYRRTYELIYRLWFIAFAVGQPASWRDATRGLLRRNIESAGSLAAIDRTSLRVIRTASRIRFTMQRFVRGLRRNVLRARRRRRNYELAMEIGARVRWALLHNPYPDNYRQTANERALEQMDEQGGLAVASSETIRGYMFVQRVRYMMQHLVRVLRARVAARRRRVRQRRN